MACIDMGNPSSMVKAKVLFMQRDPRDVVLSCFRRQFSINALRNGSILSLGDLRQARDSDLLRLRRFGLKVQLPRGYRVLPDAEAQGLLCPAEIAIRRGALCRHPDSSNREQFQLLNRAGTYCCHPRVNLVKAATACEMRGLRETTRGIRVLPAPTVGDSAHDGRRRVALTVWRCCAAAVTTEAGIR